MLNNPELKRVLKKVAQLEELRNKDFNDFTVNQLKNYVRDTQILLDSILTLQEGLEQHTVKKGYYFAEYDENSLAYCVFHTDLNSGRAYSSFPSMQEATRDAQKRNYERTGE